MASRTIVLLHGVGLDRTLWDDAAERLRSEFGDDWSVLALDLPGHGARGPVPQGVTLADLAAALAPGIPPGSVVVGFSLGALIAQHLARFRPDLVDALVSVNSVCQRTEAERAAVLQRLAAAEQDLAASAEASVRRWFDGTDVDPAVVARTREVLLANDPDSFRRCYRVFATADTEIGPELGRITVPSLALTGELDGGSTPEMSRRLAAAQPDCRVVVVPGARHMLPVQRPDEFISALTTFIRETSSVRSVASPQV